MKNLKLSTLFKDKLSNEELKQITGGRSCGCGCHYQYAGGSSVAGNGQANYKQGGGALSIGYNWGNCREYYHEVNGEMTAFWGE